MMDVAGRLIKVRQGLIKESIKSLFEDIIDSCERYQENEGLSSEFVLKITAKKKSCEITYTSNKDNGEYYVENNFNDYNVSDYLHILIGELTLKGFSAHLEEDSEFYEIWKATIKL